MKNLLLLAIVVLSQESMLSQRAGDVTTIKANVVAYNLGVEQANGSCRQSFIARLDKSAKGDDSDRYFIIHHYSSCLQPVAEETLKVDRKRRFKLRRDTNCDQRFEQLRWLITLSPDGTLNKDPWLKPLGDWEDIKVSAEKKLSCYILLSPEPFEK